MALPQRKTDIGPPNYKQFLPPVIQKNYGKWKYHEVLTPGTMVHVGESGDKLWTVRVASPRLLSTETIREQCDIAEKYCDGYLRYTTRNNVEFLVSDEKNLSRSRRSLKTEVSRWAESVLTSQMLSIHRDGFTATAHVQTHQDLLRQ